MENNIKNKIELSNKIYPYLAALSDDLLFWIAINTLFLTTVKGFSASQISLLTAIASFSAIILQGIIFKIIKKIGNIKSVRIGLSLLLLSATILTFAKKFCVISIGYIIYSNAFYFTSMGSIILKRNLKAVNKEKEFSKVQSKISFIYSLITMIIAFIAGFIFSVNNYLPMIFCIIICIFNIILSFSLFEYKSNEVETKELKNINNKSVSLNKTIIMIIATYGLLYSMVDILQSNGKLFIQSDLQKYLEIGITSIYLTIIIAFSRVFRVISNILFNKMYQKLKGKSIVLLNLLVIISAILMITGSMITYDLFGTIIMAFGFCILLFARDPINTFSKTELLNNCDTKDQEILLHRYNLSRRIITCILSIIVSILLSKYEMRNLMIILLILTIIYLYLTLTLTKKLCKKEKNK